MEIRSEPVVRSRAVKPWLRTTIFAAAFALGAGLAYLPAANLGWAWDDANLVRPSPALDDLEGLGRAVSTDLYRQAAPRLEASPYWRPLGLATYWLDTRIGYAPGALHVGNVLLHALAAALLALLLLRRARDAGEPVGATALIAPAVAAAWWTFHPQNVEAVAWISCRYELLTGVALLGLLALPWRPGWGRAALHGLIFLAGLLSKDGFGALLVVIPAMDWADRRGPAAAAPRWVAIGLALAAWWGARAALGLPGFGLPPPHEVLAYFLDAVRIYFVRALAPPALTVGHAYGPGGALGIAGGAVIVLGLAALVVWRRRLAAPVAVFLAGLVPAAVAMGKFGEVPERYLYLPSIGLAVIVAEAVAAGLAVRWRLLRWGAPAAVAILAMVGLVRIERRLPDWQDDDALFAAALRVNSEDPQANLYVGMDAGRRGAWAEARRALEIAQRADPTSGRIAGALAWAMLRTGDAAAALPHAERATAEAPHEPNGWYYLARARHATGDHAGELAAIERILELSPEFPDARFARAVAACEVSGRTDCVQAVRSGEIR
jgi:hypothetical protein